MTVPGLTTPGQRTTDGTRKPPSQVPPFSPWNGDVAAVGPGELLGAVVGREHHDRVFGDAEFVELGEQRADDVVELLHAVGIQAIARAVLVLRAQPRPHVHAGRVVPDEERLAGLDGALHEIQRAGEELLVHGLHALARDRTGVLDRLLADTPEARIDRRVIDVRGLAAQRAARAEALLELRFLRVLRVLRLLLGVEVVEVAEELVEPVHRRQVLVAVAEVVLAELAGHVAVVLQQVGDGRVLRPQAEFGARQADLQQPGAERVLARDEGRPAGRAALLPVAVGEERPFGRDAVDVRRAAAHHAAVIAGEVPDADVVTPDDEDVGFGRLRHCRLPCALSHRTTRSAGPRISR